MKLKSGKSLPRIRRAEVAFTTLQCKHAELAIEYRHADTRRVS